MQRMKQELEILSLKYLDPIGYKQIENHIEEKYGQNRDFIERARLQIAEDVYKRQVVSSTTVSGIPVQLIESSDTVLSVISGYNNTVDVVLEGKKGTIRSITADDIKATADVSAITTSGRHTVAVNITAPDGTNVVSQSLSSIFVYLDSTTSVSVPVRVRSVSYTHLDVYKRQILFSAVIVLVN